MTGKSSDMFRSYSLKKKKKGKMSCLFFNQFNFLVCFKFSSTSFASRQLFMSDVAVGKS